MKPERATPFIFCVDSFEIATLKKTLWQFLGKINIHTVHHTIDTTVLSSCFLISYISPEIINLFNFLKSRGNHRLIRVFTSCIIADSLHCLTLSSIEQFPGSNYTDNYLFSNIIGTYLIISVPPWCAVGNIVLDDFPDGYIVVTGG